MSVMEDLVKQVAIDEDADDGFDGSAKTANPPNAIEME